MNQNGKVQVRAVSAGLLGFGLVLGVGAFLVVPRSTSSSAAPRVASASVFATPTSRTAELPIPAPIRAPISAVVGSPAPLLADEFRPESPTAPQTAQVSAAPASVRGAGPASAGAVEAARAEAAVHLIATGPADVSGGAGSSYAEPSGPSAAAVGATKPAVATAKVRSRNVAAVDVVVVHYGSSDRSQLMERAAGPVYNFGALGERGDPIAGALRQVDAAQQQVQAAPDVSAADKAALNQGVDQIHSVAYQAGSAAAQATVAAGAAAAPAGSR